jgi:hypothetical protein
VYNVIAAPATTAAGAAAAAGTASAINTGFPNVILAFTPTTGYLLALGIVMFMVGVANIGLVLRSRRQLNRAFD